MKISTFLVTAMVILTLISMLSFCEPPANKIYYDPVVAEAEKEAKPKQKPMQIKTPKHDANEAYKKAFGIGGH